MSLRESLYQANRPPALKRAAAWGATVALSPFIGIGLLAGLVWWGLCTGWLLAIRGFEWLDL